MNLSSPRRLLLAVITFAGVFNALAIPVQLAAGNLGWARIDVVTTAACAVVVMLVITGPTKAAR